MEILKVNYALRGLELKGGKYEVVFEYANPNYARANKMAFGGSALLLLLLGLTVYFEIKKGKSEE